MKVAYAVGMHEEEVLVMDGKARQQRAEDFPNKRAVNH